ncbi:glycosyltransferase family 9 protein [Streptomyces sp. enrichment culture]|uniref:glycosyltransferase family 9 protein n=1 Tax=Streptomyces sp. enrichment culture TaxID=1795815 RepID=UPI003F5735C1
MTRPTSHRPRVLVLRALGLGDLLAGVPALRALRRAFPRHEMVLAVPPALEDAVAATGTVDGVLPAEAPNRGVPALTHWPYPPPEIAVDLHGNGPASRDALAALAPRRLIAYAGSRPLPEHPPTWHPHEHERARWCRLLGAHGIPADPGDVRLPPPPRPSPAPGAVVLHPGAEAAARRWPAERYAAVARALREAGQRVVVTGGPREDALVAEVCARAGLDGADVLAGGLPFAEFSALVAEAALVLSGDTGPAHLAVAHGTPSVTLFGPVSPLLWGPPPTPRHTVLWKPGPPGDPHGAEPDPRLLGIGTGEVVAAALRHLRPDAGAEDDPCAPCAL